MINRLAHLCFPFLLGMLLCWLWLSSAQAQPVPELLKDDVFVAEVRMAVDLMYNMQWKQSMQILQPWMNMYPNHPMWTFWDALDAWWEILPDIENLPQDTAMLKLFKVAIQKSEEQLAHHPTHLDALIILALSKAFIARQHSNYDRWLRAFHYGKQAYDLVQKIEKLYPGLPDIQFATGMFDYYLDFVRREYSVVEKLQWVLPSGDRERGLAKLNLAAEQAIFVRQEAQYFLGNIHQYYEWNRLEAVVWFKRLHEAYPDNSFFMKRLAGTYAQRGDFRSVELVYTTATQRNWQYAQAPVLKEELLHLMGRKYYSEGQVEQAVAFFEASSSVITDEPHRYVHISNTYYRGLIEKDRQNTSQALALFTQAVKHGQKEWAYTARSKLELQRLKAQQK